MQANGIPPNPTARCLATIPRGRGEELRVSLDEYKGHPYISLRVWSGEYPVKGKGVTVRLSEVEEVIRALAEGADLGGRDDWRGDGAAGGEGPDWPPLPPAGGRDGRPPGQDGGRVPFDEFAGGDG